MPPASEAPQAVPRPTDRRSRTRERILTSARHLFNRRGLTAVSIDEVMEGAGLTRGGFYSHFASKEALYAEAITQFGHTIPNADWQCIDPGPSPRPSDLGRLILDSYLSRGHFEDVGGSCPMVGLPSDVARSGPQVKAAFRGVLEMMVAAFSGGLAGAGLEGEGQATRARALGLAALCVGGMVLARAVDDPAMSDELRSAARQLALECAGWDESPAAPP